MHNLVEYKQGDPWVMPERNVQAGKLFKVIASKHRNDGGNKRYNQEPAWRIGNVEGNRPDVWFAFGTIGLLIKCVRDRWIVLIGDQKFHMHEDSLELLEEKDRINCWRHLNHAES